MPRFALLRAGMRALLTSVILTALFASGVVTGLCFYPQVFTTTADSDPDDHDHDPHDPCLGD